MAIVTYNAPLKANNLNLLTAAQQNQWDKNPLILTNLQQMTMDYSRVLTIIQGTDLTPSKLIGLKPTDPIPDSIQLCDALYNDGISDYKTKLNYALALENAFINQLRINFKRPGLINRIIYKTARFFCMKKRDVRFHRNDYVLQFNYATSAHRIAWMNQVGTLEKVRLDQVKNEIQLRCDILMSELIPLNAQGETDQEKVIELDQNYRVFKVHLPKEEMSVVLENRRYWLHLWIPFFKRHYKVTTVITKNELQLRCNALMEELDVLDDDKKTDKKLFKDLEKLHAEFKVAFPGERMITEYQLRKDPTNAAPKRYYVDSMIDFFRNRYDYS